ncbi:MAG: hypothetical protein A2Y33_05095 [Spirochaetes bacterium GWF1_51_8]|nr:MAG: hypothetical protein A2Y33_05095 [Spirochaetes bacterium GWF1_51_8]
MDKNIQELLSIIEKLKNEFNTGRDKEYIRNFTLDGKLVGDIGEVLAEEHYRISLLPASEEQYDAETEFGKKVQIKTTMKNNLNFPRDNVPELYLGIKVSTEGENIGDIIEIFNGPGKLIRDKLTNRKTPNERFYTITITRLAEWNKEVQKEEKVQLRNGKSVFYL